MKRYLLKKAILWNMSSTPNYETGRFFWSMPSTPFQEARQARKARKAGIARLARE